MLAIGGFSPTPPRPSRSWQPSGDAAHLHVGIQPYMRIPVGSRAEAAALKADQDAAKVWRMQPEEKGRKKRPLELGDNGLVFGAGNDNGHG